MAEEGQVIACHTVEAWTEQLDKGKETSKLFVLYFPSGSPSVQRGIMRAWIVVDFTASWCGPCRFIAPVLQDLAKKMPNVTFLKVDVDELRTVAEDWAVEAMPTFMFVKEGKIVDKVVGANKEELQSTIAKHATEVAAA